MVEGVGRGERRWEGCGVDSEARLGLVCPSFRLSFYAEFPAPQQHLLQVLLTVVVFHDALSLPTPEQLLQVGPRPIYLCINHPLPAPGPGPPNPKPPKGPQYLHPGHRAGPTAGAVFIN